MNEQFLEIENQQLRVNVNQWRRVVEAQDELVAVYRDLMGELNERILFLQETIDASNKKLASL